jgi:hypothetical protein
VYSLCASGDKSGQWSLHGVLWHIKQVLLGHVLYTSVFRMGCND